MNLDLKQYWEERLANLDVASVGYLGLGRQYNRWLYRLRRRVFRRTVARSGLPFDGLNVLDIGSGTGFYVEEWNALGAHAIVASDFTNAAVSSLRARFPRLEVKQFDITASTLPWKRSAFGAVSAMDVLFHITDDVLYERALSNVAALLRPQGYFIFTENLVHGSRVRSPHHVSRPIAEVQDCLGRLGFVVVDRRPMFFLMNQPADSNSKALRRCWRLVERVVSRHEVLGYVVGASLFPLDLLLVSSRHEGPSTEIVVCRRVDHT